MKRTHSFLALFVVWAVVLISAGALAYALGPPLPVMALADAPTRTLVEVTRQTAPVTIHANAVAIVVQRTAPAVVVEARELRCASWTSLSQGPAGSQVRYCE